MSDSVPKQDLPLAGMKVLDLSRALSGPFCSLVLGDLGADVVKVEPCPKGDMSREWGPFDRGISAYYLSANRNKRGIGVNFRSAEGLRLLRELALASDVVIENFRPGTMREIGLDPEELRRIKPELIIAGISGYGVGGPLGERAGFDQIAQGHSGFMSFTGTVETGPMRVGVAIGDLTAGMWLVIGVLAAWIERKASGQGRLVETSLLSSLVGLLSVQGQRYLSVGEVPGPTGNVHPVIAPYGVFHAQDGDMNIACATQDMWLKFCDLLGRPDLKSDVRFIDNAGRMGHRDALKIIIEKELARKTRAQWTELLVAAQIPAGPINALDDVFEDEQVAHLKLVETTEHAILGKVRQVSNPIVFDGLAGQWIRLPPPVLGEHTHDVLAEFGYSREQIDAWTDAGVIFQYEPASVQAPETPVSGLQDDAGAGPVAEDNQLRVRVPS